MVQGPSSVHRKRKSRRGQSLRAARTRSTGNNDNDNEVKKVTKQTPAVQGPVMRLSDGSLQAAIRKGRLQTTGKLDIEVKEILEHVPEVEEQVVQSSDNNLDHSDQDGGQERGCTPGFDNEDDTKVMGSSTEFESQPELVASVLDSVNVIKQMMERNEEIQERRFRQDQVNQERRHRENEENQERRHNELCAILMKQKGVETKTFACLSAEIQKSEISIQHSEETKSSGCRDTDVVDDAFAHPSDEFANIDAKTLESVDRSLDSFADNIDLLIYSLEKTSFKHPDGENGEKEITNPDQSRWFRYNQTATDNYVELCQLVPQVVQSYRIPRERAAIARLNIDGLHRCTAVSGWDTPYPKDDMISNYTWTLQVEEICKIIKHTLPEWGETWDHGFPGRYHACHAEKQLIAWYLYENTFAKYQVTMDSPYALPYRKIKSSAPRGALIVVSREICDDCREFIGKVKKYFEIPDHFYVESRTCPDDTFDMRKTDKLSESCNEWRNS
ncbi:hypothetical protein NHQ30_008721 [Ciborinia camelliae]|nr:hypothetical protein NHQ30_008721 [Ciborinia camelliae]